MNSSCWRPAAPVISPTVLFFCGWQLGAGKTGQTW